MTRTSAARSLVLPASGATETLRVYTAGADQAPLYPHRATQTIDGVDYTVATYVTEGATLQESYNLTVLVTWSSNVSHGTKTVTQRSTAYSPSGCLSTATHPFSGPCQAFFNGQAGVTTANIAVTNDSDSSLDIVGFNGIAARLSLPSLSSSVGVEQTMKLSASAQTSLAEAVTSAGKTTSGGLSAVAPADTDPSSSSQTSASATTAAQTSSSQTLTGLAGTLAVTPTTGDTGGATSQVVAGATGCDDELGTAVIPNQPCASAQLKQAGSPGGISIGLAGASSVRSLPTFFVAQIAPPSVTPDTNRAFVSRLLAPNGSRCLTASGSGCISSGVSRTLGAIAIGGLPAAESGDDYPAGFDFAFKVTGLGETARAEAGNGANAAISTYSRAGTLTYWSGSSYASVPLTASGTYDVPSANAIYRNGANYVSITVDSSITVQPAPSAPAVTGSMPCTASPCSTVVTGPSVIRAVTHYLVTVNGIDA